MSVPALRFKDDNGRDFPEWKETILSKVADSNIKWSLTGGPFGSNLKAEDYTESGVRIIQLQNIGDGIFNDGYKIYTSPKKADELLSCNIYPNEIIISKMGDPVARCCIMPSSAERYLMASDGIRLVVDKTRFNPKYIHDFINHETFRKNALENSTGSTRRRIGLDELKKLPVIYPCLSEQTKIANFLTAVDEKITQLTQKHDLLTQYKKGVMQQIFSQELRFKDDDGEDFPEWEEKELRTLCDLITKGTTPTSVGHEFKNSGINFIKIESLEADGKLIKEKLGFIDADAHAKLFRSQLKLYDLLFSIAGALGRVAIVTDEFLPANTNQALAIIRLSEGQSLDTKYVFYTLTNDRIKKLIESISVQLAQANLSLKDIGDFVIELPCIKEQTKIANFLTAIDDKITATQAQLHAVKQYKHGLLQQMFV